MKRWKIELPIAPVSRKNAEDVWGELRSSVTIGASTVKIEGIKAPDQNGARDLAVAAANRLLDQLAFLHGAAHQIVDGGQKYSIVGDESQPSQGVAQLRADMILVDHADVHDRVMIEKRDASGNIIGTYDSDSPGTLPGACTAAMGYYRRGVLATDTYESFRNKCLAVEKVVAAFCTSDGFKGSEAKRWEHTLGAVYGDLTRRRNLDLVWPTATPKTLAALAEYLYRDVRCALSHSRDPQQTRLPYEQSDVEAMKRVGNLVERVAHDLVQFEIARNP